MIIISYQAFSFQKRNTIKRRQIININQRGIIGNNLIKPPSYLKQGT